MLHSLRRNFGEYPSQFWLLVSGSLVSSIGGAMVWPFLTIYLRERLDIPMTVVTLLLTVNSVAGVLSSFLAGPSADRFGRKGIMAVSLLAGAAYYVLMTQANSLSAFAVLIFLGGAFNILYPVGANAMVADLVELERRTDAYAIVRIVHNIGVAIGPAAGGFMAAVSYTNTFLTAAVCYVLFALLVIFFIRETLPTAVRGEKNHSVALKASPSGPAGYGYVFKDGQFMSFMAMFIMTMMSAAIMFMLLPVYSKENFGMPESHYGFIVTANALMCIFVQYFVTIKTRNKPAFPVLGVGALFYGIGVGSVALGSSFWAFLIAMVIMTVGELIMTPTATSLAANLAPVDMRGRYMSIYGLSWPVGSGIGTVLAGWINDTFAPVYIWYAGLAFGLLSAVGFFILSARKKRQPVPNSSIPAVENGLVELGDAEKTAL